MSNFGLGFTDSLPRPVRKGLEMVVATLEGAFSDDVMPRRLYEAASHYVRHRGKLIRPTLVLLTAYELKGEKVIERSIYAAASVELVHIATLLQDDIMDGHFMRRGIPTPYLLYGLNTAILASDVMIAKAIEYAAKSGDLDVVIELSNAALKLAIGQTLDLEIGVRGSVSIEDYLNLVRYKTASLIESSLVIGSYMAGYKEKQFVNRLRKLGELIGLAFQVRDDIIDFLNSDTRNPGTRREANIIRVFVNKGLRIKEALEKARELVNRVIDDALRLADELLGGYTLGRYISLLRV